MIRWLKNIALVLAGTLAGRGLVRRGRDSNARDQTREPEPSQEHRKSRVKTWGIRAAIAVPTLAVLGFLIAASGIVPIKASSGHWGITEWFLNFSMSRSVSTHSIGIRVPRLDDPALVMKGAGHYHTGCRPCHGAPDLLRPRIADHLTPNPPNLSEVVPEWNAKELFYIVKHGLKFTGMPAWPAPDRSDEVWAMVAFLSRLPEMDATTYLRFAGADEVARAAHGIRPAPDSTSGGAHPPLVDLADPEDVPPAVRASCARCHGMDGNGRGMGAFPRLAGQRPSYLYTALQAYALGARHSGIMEPVAAGMSLQEMQQLARYYAAQRPRRVTQNAAAVAIAGATLAADGTDAIGNHTPADFDAGASARGKAIATKGIPRHDVPSCVDCHGPFPTRRNRFYPRLAGQYFDYLVLQLELFSSDRRGGSHYAHLMQKTASQLTAEQMRDVAAFYASLPPEGESVSE